MNRQLKSIYNTAVQLVTADTDSWLCFLDYSSHIYNYSFDNALLAYAQNPNATMLATLPIWNRVGRRVNAGARAIAVSEISDNSDLSIRYLFDIEQTHGDTIPKLWTIDQSLTSPLLESLNQDHGLQASSLEEYLQQITNAGNLLKLEHLIDHLPDRLAHVQQDVALITEQLTEAKASVNVPFEFEQELSVYLKRQVEIDTKLEFDRAKQEDVVSDEDAIKNGKEGQAMGADKKGINDNLLGESVISQQNELFEAVKQKDDQKVKQLLDAGAYADVFDAEQKTPLYYAVTSGDEKMTRLLIDAGANPELRAAGRSLTEYCANDRIRSILQKQGESNNQSIEETPEDGITRGRSR